MTLKQWVLLMLPQATLGIGFIFGWSAGRAYDDRAAEVPRHARRGDQRAPGDAGLGAMRSAQSIHDRAFPSPQPFIPIAARTQCKWLQVCQWAESTGRKPERTCRCVNPDVPIETMRDLAVTAGQLA